ncbi:hypothetical protein FACS189456_4820 [Bacteroidia bacterium]|nr:hypothetical protein FACS189456_4820 [Bacteroidia bacterium]
MLKSHNEKYEAQLQQLVEDNPPALFSAAKPKKKGDDVFDEFAKMRAAELRQILNTKYTDFEKKQFMVRNDLKKGILAYNEEQIKKEQAQREAMAVAAAQRKAAKLAKTQTENQKKKAKEAAKGKKNKGDKKKGKKKK